MTKYLFVCGAPRSGTTLLTKILGSNESVVLGIERFKRQLGSAYVPELFLENRFFDHEQWSNDTNAQYSAYREYYDKAKEKYRDAVYVGDKIPHIYRRIVQINKAFSHGAAFVFCHRNLCEVAASWNARAQNPKDAWPESNDYRKAIEVWLDSLESATHAKKLGICVYNFSYNRFADAACNLGVRYYLDLLDALSLRLTLTDSCEMLSQFSYFDRIKEKREALTCDMVDYLKQNLRFDIVENFMDVFRMDHNMLSDLIGGLD